jgi:hypothetical protein
VLHLGPLMTSMTLSVECRQTYVRVRARRDKRGPQLFLDSCYTIADLQTYISMRSPSCISCPSYVNDPYVSDSILKTSKEYAIPDLLAFAHIQFGLCEH